MSLLSTLRELECELHDPRCRGDRDRLAQLLAPEFKEFGRSGASYSRDLKNLPANADSETKIHAQDFVVQGATSI